MATGLFVAGKWSSGSGVMEIRNKYSGAVIGQVALAGEREIEAALASAVSGANVMADMPTHRRTEVLFAVAAGIRAERESLAQTIAAEAGKPSNQARVEVERAANTCQVASVASWRAYG